MLLVIAYCEPKYSRVRLSTGNQFDVIGLTRDSRLATGDSATSTVVIVLKYYAKADSPAGRLREADEILEVARPSADSIGASEIEIQQTYPIGWRWTGLVRGFVWRYKKTSEGAWLRR